jgi:hypothetical protein
MADEPVDPLLMGQRVVAILETGLRTATYKLATLTALADHCIEQLPKDPGDPLSVPIPDLAHRVLEIYWRQVLPFYGHELRQSTQPRARILIAASQFRSAAAQGHASASLDVAIMRPLRHTAWRSTKPSYAWHNSRCTDFSDYLALRKATAFSTTTRSLTTT